MERIHGHKGTRLIECINPALNKWRVRWDIQPCEQQEGISCLEQELQHKPTIEQVRAIIERWIDSKTSERITDGFNWDGIPVPLQVVDQMNYYSTYVAATQIAEFEPIIVKIGGQEPVYKTFDKAAYMDFYMAIVKHVQAARQAGWEEKETIDYERYKKLLKKTR